MFKPGQSGNPAGRPPGAKHRSTIAIRDAYHKLLENNLDNLNDWLAKIASRDPHKAADLMLRLSEYILPKLNRTELTGQDGQDLFANITFTFNTANDGKTQEGTPQESAGQESENPGRDGQDYERHSEIPADGY